jgi:F-type H+-transporting ATPase subunit a
MHISIQPEALFYIGSIPITNSLLTSWLGTLLLIVVGVLVGKNFKRLPSGIQHIFEMAYEMFDNLAKDSLGKAGAKFVPFLVTLFLFIITSNWLGVFPGVGSLGFTHEAAKVEHAATGEATKTEGEAAKDGEHKTVFVPLFRGGSADLNTTFALALIAMTVVHVSGARSAGLKNHLAHFKNPLEIVSELGKILSFGFRLFGNMFAGEVLLAAMASILAIITGRELTLYGIPGGILATPFLMFELFVGFIQAFVFAVLTLSFLSLFYKTEHSAHH